MNINRWIDGKEIKRIPALWVSLCTLFSMYFCRKSPVRRRSRGPTGEVSLSAGHVGVGSL